MIGILRDIWFYCVGVMWLLLVLLLVSAEYYAIEYVVNSVRNFVNKHKEVPHVR